MKFLVDANVLSEPTKLNRSAQVMAWLDDNNRQLVVNPIILGEIRSGILHLPAGRRRAELEMWFARGVKTLRVLDMDAATAEIWAVLLAELRRIGREMPVKDSLIAATARQHRLTVATRNIADYRHAGVALVNPFEA